MTNKQMPHHLSDFLGVLSPAVIHLLDYFTINNCIQALKPGLSLKEGRWQLSLVNLTLAPT